MISCRESPLRQRVTSTGSSRGGGQELMARNGSCVEDKSKGGFIQGRQPLGYSSKGSSEISILCI